MEGVVISVQTLQDTNQRLDVLIKILSPAQKSLSVTPEHMAALLAELLCAGEWLGAGLAHNAEGGMANELERYRLRLEQLRHLLPTLHAQLLTERSRLQAEKNHLEATAAWARSTLGQTR
jgi:hypothetical protein